MPPHVSSTSHSPLLTRSELGFSPYHNKHNPLKRMEITFTRKRFIHTLVFILACISIFRLFRFAITTYSSSPQSVWPVLLRTCNNTSDSMCSQVSMEPVNSKPITKKEYRFLKNIILQRAPCNLLIFGWEPQYRHLGKINGAGITVFLEDNPARVKGMKGLNRTNIYKVDHDIPAKEAFKLLKHAREETACIPDLGSLETSACKLALKKLPDIVYGQNWDLIIVDGPRSDGPEAPGRMAAIYTSSVIARARNITTNVVVHDVDRMVERWFSWEFLCEENLVSSKGRYWNFGIKGGKQSNSTRFCSQEPPSKV